MHAAQDMFCRPSEERALLSYCMKDISKYFSVCAKLEPNDFLYSQHELIMLLFRALVSKGAEKLEQNLLVAEATAENILDAIGGVRYIKTISDIRLDDGNFELYLNSVIDASMKYKLYCSLKGNVDVIEQNAKEGLSSSELLGRVESGLLTLSTSGVGISEPRNLSEGLDEYLEERRENKIELRGISSGYPILDKQIDGLVPGTLLVLAARKKVGKSSLLTNISTHVAYRLNIPVLYVDTEMSFMEWRPRALACISGVKERDIIHGGYDDISNSRLQKAKRVVELGKLYHEYMPGYSVDRLVSLYKKYRHKEKIGLIVFDYLKEPDSSSIDRQRKEYQVLGDITTKLKDLAGTLNIPAITAVQLNRDNDIADSDRIARYADVTCNWEFRTEEELKTGGINCGTHKLVIKDSRRGGSTSREGIGYMFFKEFAKISEVPIDKQYFTNFCGLVNTNSAEETLKSGYENEELL